MIAQKSHKSKCCGDISGGGIEKGKTLLLLLNQILLSVTQFPA